MKRMCRWFTYIDVRITKWMARYGILLLRVSLGIVFFWFGVLKFLPGLSPAQGLATRTIGVLTFGLIHANVSILILATAVYIVQTPPRTAA